VPGGVARFRGIPARPARGLVVAAGAGTAQGRRRALRPAVRRRPSARASACRAGAPARPWQAV